MDEPDEVHQGRPVDVMADGRSGATGEPARTMPTTVRIVAAPQYGTSYVLRALHGEISTQDMLGARAVPIGKVRML